MLLEKGTQPLVLNFGKGSMAATDELIAQKGNSRPVAIPVAVQSYAIGIEAGGEAFVIEDVGRTNGARPAGYGVEAVGVGGGDDVEGNGRGDQVGMGDEIVNDLVGKDGRVPL